MVIAVIDEVRNVDASADISDSIEDVNGGENNRTIGRPKIN